jgi:membrane dipeptidase
MQIPLFDAHCDTLLSLDRKGGSLYNNPYQLNLSSCGDLTPHARFFALFGNISELQISPCEHIDRLYQIFQGELKKYSDRMMLCTNAEQADQAAREGKLAAFLSVEGAELLDCSVLELRKAYQRGIRAVNITWNHANALSGSCREEKERGLGEEGRAFVSEMLRFGMLPDVSHLSEPGFWDVYELCKSAGKPFIASHSNALSVCAHPRNLSDRQFEAIVSCSGAAGINLYATFLTDRERCTLDDVVRHIEHFLSLVGQKSIAIGSDFDGCDILPEEIKGAQDLNKLYERLLRENYSEQLVRDIFYNNMLRVVRLSCAM